MHIDKRILYTLMLTLVIMLNGCLTKDTSSNLSESNNSIPAKLSIFVGEKISIQDSLHLLTLEKAVFLSSDITVATVSKTGIITGISTGSAIISTNIGLRNYKTIVYVNSTIVTRAADLKLTLLSKVDQMTNPQPILKNSDWFKVWVLTPNKYKSYSFIVTKLSKGDNRLQSIANEAFPFYDMNTGVIYSEVNNIYDCTEDTCTDFIMRLPPEASYIAFGVPGSSLYSRYNIEIVKIKSKLIPGHMIELANEIILTHKNKGAIKLKVVPEMFGLSKIDKAYFSGTLNNWEASDENYRFIDPDGDGIFELYLKDLKEGIFDYKLSIYFRGSELTNTITVVDPCADILNFDKKYSSQMIIY